MKLDYTAMCVKTFVPLRKEEDEVSKYCNVYWAHAS